MSRKCSWLTATPEGVHYVSHDLSKPGPRLVMTPDIAPWIQYSQVAADDIFDAE